VECRLVRFLETIHALEIVETSGGSRLIPGPSPPQAGETNMRPAAIRHLLALLASAAPLALAAPAQADKVIYPTFSRWLADQASRYETNHAAAPHATRKREKIA